MRDTYSISRVIINIEYSVPSLVYTVDRNSTKLEDIKKLCDSMFNNDKISYNEHLRYEIWLNRANGISECIYVRSTKFEEDKYSKTL